jgi:hypothetical protein
MAGIGHWAEDRWIGHARRLPFGLSLSEGSSSLGATRANFASETEIPWHGGSEIVLGGVGARWKDGLKTAQRAREPRPDVGIDDHDRGRIGGCDRGGRCGELRVAWRSASAEC